MNKRTTIDLLAEKIVVDKFVNPDAYIRIQDAKKICKKCVSAALEGMEQRMIDRVCEWVKNNGYCLDYEDLDEDFIVAFDFKDKDELIENLRQSIKLD